MTVGLKISKFNGRVTVGEISKLMHKHFEALMETKFEINNSLN